MMLAAQPRGNFQMKYGAWALGAVLGGAAMSAPAAAQLTPKSMSQGGLARSVAVNARATTEYNSNVTRSDPNLVTNSGLSRGDTVLTPSITANIIQPIGQQA